MSYIHQNQVVTNKDRQDGAWMTKCEYADPGYLRVAFLDANVVEGATGVLDAGKQIAATPEGKAGPEHAHPNSGETLFFLGTEETHNDELHGEVEIYINGEKYIITKSCNVYIPPNVPHGPVIFKKVDRPILFAAILHDEGLYNCVETGNDPRTNPKDTQEMSLYINYKNSRTDPDPEWFKTEAFQKDRWHKAVFTDTEVVPGAAMSDCEWKLNATPEGGGHPFHYHPYSDEVLLFCGSDPDNPNKLTGEVIWYVEGEPVTMTEQGMIYMPRNMRHGPMIFTRIDADYPVMCCQTTLGGEGARKYVSIPPT